VDPDTSIGGANRNFPSTQHSLLNAAAAGLETDGVDRIVALYWKPVYHFIRLKFRKSNEDAKDLTQSFFTTALQRDFFSRFDPARASFRTYLRMAVERFAANEYASANRQKRGGGIALEQIEDDTVSTTESPEQIFEREWRRQLFVLAIEDLRSICEAAQKNTHFQIFQAYDLAADRPPSYSELGTEFGIPETSVTNHIAWARRTLRALVSERLRGVTSGNSELREEMRRVWI